MTEPHEHDRGKHSFQSQRAPSFNVNEPGVSKLKRDSVPLNLDSHPVAPVNPFRPEHRNEHPHFSSTRTKALCACAAVLLLSMLPAGAHTEGGIVGGFASGFTHPLFGLDHIIAMFAVGLWGAFLGAPAIWMLPIVFPLVMALGGALGVLGIPVPAVETGIAVSAIALGLLVALAARPPLWVAAAAVGCFAIFHGHAHGTELPAAANPLSYAVGFVTSTGLLHAAGIGAGELSRFPWGAKAVRFCGAAIAVLGAGFLFKFL